MRPCTCSNVKSSSQHPNSPFACSPHTDDSQRHEPQYPALQVSRGEGQRPGKGLSHAEDKLVFHTHNTTQVCTIVPKQRDRLSSSLSPPSPPPGFVFFSRPHLLPLVPCPPSCEDDCPCFACLPHQPRPHSLCQCSCFCATVSALIDAGSPCRSCTHVLTHAHTHAHTHARTHAHSTTNLTAIHRNNDYHQSIDIGDTDGRPVLHGIMSGKFYTMPSAGKQIPTMRKVAGLIVDPVLNQPMSKSLMEGAYYRIHAVMPANGPLSARSATNFVQRNRTMTRHYSHLVSGARSVNPSSAPEIWDRTMATPQTTGPFHRMSRPVSKSMRSGMQDMPTPRDAEELQNMWGRTLDPKFIATTMTWLQKATPAERENFKHAVGSISTPVPSCTPVYPDRGYSEQMMRPWTARSRMQSDLDTPGEATLGEDTTHANSVLGTFVRKPAPPCGTRHMSARVEPTAVSAAIAFARSRPTASPRATGPERYLTPRTPRMSIAPATTKATFSPRPPPIIVDSPMDRREGATLGIQGTLVALEQPVVAPPGTAISRAGTPRAHRVAAQIGSQIGPIANDLHAQLQVRISMYKCTFVYIYVCRCIHSYIDIHVHVCVCM